jgi:ribosome-binding ATPase YchF (GTP1/OBG family)
MFGKSDSDKNESADAADASWQALDEAHRQYFLDVSTAQLDAQEALRALQVEYEKKMLRAANAEDVRNATTEFEKAIQERAASLGSDAYGGALDKYRSAVQKVLANAPAEHLSHSALAALGQSLLMVAAHAATFASAPQTSDQNPPRV